MTTYFSDTFAGGSGTLSGHAPDTGFGGLAWSTSNMVLNGAGFAGPSNNSNRSVYGEATFGNSSTARSLPGTVDITFTLKTGPDVSGTTENTGFVVRIYANGKNYDFVFGGTGSGWASFIYLGANTMAYPSVSANTEYACSASISPTNASFTIAGNTTTEVFTTPSPALGVTGVYLLVGGTCLVGDLVIKSPPATQVYALAPAVLGAAKALATSTAPPTQARSAAPAVFGGLKLVALHDFTGLLGDVISVYVMDLITPTGAVRVPISSWQATLQTGASNYLQCVVPACTVWVAALAAATEFAIYRRAVLPSGAAIEHEMARAPASTVQYDRGPARHTCTLSGYSSAFAANAEPDAAYDRTLTGVRSVSSGSSMRVRCAVDWLLRPGQRAFVDGIPLLVGYINYYAPSGFDSYMDVGEQA